MKNSKIKKITKTEGENRKNRRDQKKEQPSGGYTSVSPKHFEPL